MLTSSHNIWSWTERLDCQSQDDLDTIASRSTIISNRTPTNLVVPINTSKIRMILSIFLPLMSLVAAMPHPYPNPDPLQTSTSPGQCTSAGQFICVSATTFAICDASLTGTIQHLAPGDARCRSSGTGDPGPTTTPPPASPTTAGFFDVLYSMLNGVDGSTRTRATATTPTTHPGVSTHTNYVTVTATPPRPPPASTPPPITSTKVVTVGKSASRTFAGTMTAVGTSVVPTSIVSASGTPPPLPPRKT
ncbi:hypothetical protein PV04_08464 [Phialophora macrospora]|uniref:Uncharacterized protein n=1 Tax=Phialophora macrospora TaxID=1851006 RepID=A0A0D2FHI7_9EURO|nr:hypothetical protein PV04_08464 [Phialophora macrospora]